jgi:hypothetical protein
LAFDRAALSFTTLNGAVACVAEMRRILRPGGLFQCSPYSDRDSSFYRSPDRDGTVRNIGVGTILGGSQVCFYSLDEVRRLFRDGWQMLSLKHLEETEMIRPDRTCHGEWLVIARRI